MSPCVMLKLKLSSHGVLYSPSTTTLGARITAEKRSLHMADRNVMIAPLLLGVLPANEIRVECSVLSCNLL